MDRHRRLKRPNPKFRLKLRQRKLLYAWLILAIVLNLLANSVLYFPLFVYHMFFLIQLIPLVCFLLSVFRDHDFSTMLRYLAFFLFIICIIAFLVPLILDLRQVRTF